MGKDVEKAAKEKRITRAMRYEIIKPVDCTWEEFGKVLYSLQRQCAHMANYDIQQLWQWDNYQREYKAKNGVYPPKTERPNLYKLLREKFPDVGTSVLSQVDMYVQRKYKADRKGIFLLQKSIPFFRDTFPICVANQGYIIRDADGYEIDARLLPKEAEQSRFTFIIKWGDRSKRAILDKLLSGEYKQGMLQIIRDRHKKWYAVISFTFTPKPREVSETAVLEVTLGENELVCKKGESQRVISMLHLKDSVARIDQRIEALKEQRYYRGEGRRGHGVNKIFDPLEIPEKKKANFKATANHNLSRDIVNTARRWKCGAITVTGDIPDWTTADLCSKIKYKAEELDITVL